MDEQARASVPDLEPWAPAAASLGRGAIVAVAVVNILNAYAIVAGPRENERYWFLLVTETSPGTWLSVTLLTATALLAGVCWRIDQARRRPFWLLIAAAALAMSLDDGAEVHERVGGTLGEALGDKAALEYLWVVPWALVALVIAVVLWRMRPRLPGSVRWPLVAGAGISIGAATILEVVATMTVNDGGTVTQRFGPLHRRGELGDDRHPRLRLHAGAPRTVGEPPVRACGRVAVVTVAGRQTARQ